VTVPPGALIRDRRQPALGHGRLVSLGEPGWGRVVWSGGEPQDMRLGEDLVRARLQAGQPVAVGEREGVVVGGAAGEEPDDLWRYRVLLEEVEEVWSEAELEPVRPPADDPRATLVALRWQGAQTFAARLRFLRVLSCWYENGFGIPAFLGARIFPLPHQIHAARRVLTDRVPRYLLADEVGLGKTIEAGLVLQALAAANPELRVLVIAPGAMSRQWLCELFLRFGEQVFSHLDAGRLEQEAHLLVSPRVIVSTTALEACPQAREEVFKHRWDVVVVDEAHQIHPDGSLYGFLRRLASHSWGLLALSATPAKGDVRGLLGLLGLVAPEVYDPAKPERFAVALASREAVAERLDSALRHLEEGAVTPEWERGERAALAELLPDDPHLRAAASDEGADLAELLAYVQEHHRVDHRIVRTRRGTVLSLGTRLCAREQTTLRYRPSPAEVALVKHMDALPSWSGNLQAILCGLYRRRACTSPVPLLALLGRRRDALNAAPSAGKEFDPLAALGADPGPAEEEYLLERVIREAPALPGEAAWLAEAFRLTHAWMTASMGGCARHRAALDWLRKALRRGKVLVFAQDREVVEAFAEVLSDELGPDRVGAIHHGLAEVQLSEIALRFQQPEGPCRVLVSDELGGEGRNFQVAAAVLHLDQPWAVGRVEQRIGRLDRIGRKAERSVRSGVLVGPMASEQAIFALHSEALEVYRRSLGGLEFLLPEVQRQLAQAACAGPAALEALLAPLTERVTTERAHADRAYERSLDASARQLEEASEQAEVIAMIDGEGDADAIRAWAATTGIEFKPIGDALWSAGWSWEHLERMPPGLAPSDPPPEEGRVRRRGTFSRNKALGDESLELFAPGHPLIDALVRDLETTSVGRAAALTRNLGPERQGHAYLLVVAQTELVAGDLPAGLRYRAQAHLWPQVRLGVVRLRPGQETPAELVRDAGLRAQLETPDTSDRTLDPDVLAKSIDLTALWAAMDAGLDLALATLATTRQAEVQDATQRLSAELAEDIAFLRGQAARGDSATRAAAEAGIAARERLVKAVAAERLTLAALALVIGVGG
jgi:ATP-dependent helicase HepA